jgi:hypothetical protein
MDRLSISSGQGSWLQLVTVGSSKYPELVRIGQMDGLSISIWQRRRSELVTVAGCSKYLELVRVGMSWSNRPSKYFKLVE